jgi:beta-glucosidase/6-phospho-beta-glucosidase/beta-galactosidase
MPYNATTGKHERSQAGIDFYKGALGKMRANSITPVVALFHWDLPNDLSWLEDAVVEEFAKYAALAFEEFQMDVSDWATFNEPNSFCENGYAAGNFAPGHRSTTDHLLCSKNVLLSHARAVETFRTNKYPGQIGIILDYKWVYPDNASSAEDLELSQLDRDNVLGIYADPIFGTGDFPESVKAFYGDFMPVLSAEDQSALRGSADFIGLNTYGGRAVNRSAYSTTLADFHAGDSITERYSYCPCAPGMPQTHVENYTFECGADSTSWLWIKPDAMYQYLNYFKTNYGNPKVYVTEFGVDVKGESDMEIATALQDDFRQTYFQLYMMQIAKAKNEGVNVKGVFAWTMLDNLEWHDGMNFRFGITYVDYTSDNITRYPKNSAIWWQGLIASMSSTTVTV